MQEEIWKDIVGYEGKYQVSNKGRVKSVERKRECRVNGGTIAVMTVPEKIMKQWKRSKYLLVDLWKDSKRDVRSVHELVYEAFVGKIKDGMLIHHKDKNKYNNTPENLQMLSAKEHNRIHSFGKKAWNKDRFKERNLKIFSDKQYGMNYEDLMKKYNLSKRHLYFIIGSFNNAYTN